MRNFNFLGKLKITFSLKHFRYCQIYLTLKDIEDLVGAILRRRLSKKKFS